MKRLTVIDLFSGCGGLSYGLYQEGFKILAGIDKWDAALKTFQINHKDAFTICTDLTQFKPQKLMKQLNLNKGDLDCLVGGPPCQGFSKNVPAAYRFLEDPRNLLFRNYLDWVKALYPKVVLMENVAPIFNAYGGAVRYEIIETLEKLGYKTKVKTLWAHDYGVPQRRQRCFFFASRTGISPAFPEPSFAKKEENNLFEIKQQHCSAWAAISDLPVLQNGEGYEPMPYDMLPQNNYQKIMRENSNILLDHITRQLREKQFARISSLRAGEGIKDLPPEIRPKAGYSGAYGRLDFEMVAPTITRWVFHPGSGRFCHPREVCLITIREAARIQSFSDEFRFTGTYIEKSHQIGNAVPPLLMRVFAKHIRACF
ncbi:DNA cytosine methyltransferase [Candidatus Parabeggiatoa sp. HSG14]|uniref:DNA cytosine methyltransferase n=1 Tax=Candidatus Parabeggiatoa sp. HSG14 TaxID=3055593 RepID=UPI0025A8EED8|nr:DNA cytosine methyltransferase [Thiotrichales bacterium HSG14]